MGIYTKYKELDAYIKKCEWKGIAISPNYYHERKRLEEQIRGDDSSHIFERIFSKKTARIMRIMLLAGFVAWLVNITIIMNTQDGFTWTDATNFGSLAATGLWWTWLVILLPFSFWYLIVRRIILIFNPDIEDGAEIWRATHVSLFEKLWNTTIGNDTLWCTLHPITRDYAEHIYSGAAWKQYHKTVPELTDDEVQHINETKEDIMKRRRIYVFMNDCEANNIRWNWQSCRLLLAEGDDHNAMLSARSEEAYQQRLEKAAAKNGWDDWKDDDSTKHPAIKEESVTERITRLVREGRL